MTNEPQTHDAPSTSATPIRGAVARHGTWGRLVTLALATLATVNLWLIVSQLRSAADNSRERAFWALCHSGTTAEERAELFLKLVAEGNTEWGSAKLGDLKLSNVDLAQSQLESAAFSSCEFVACDFSNALLDRVRLETSDLTGADFSSVRFRDGTLLKSELEDADFRNADLLSTSFEQVTARNAVFAAARMGDAFLAMADLTGADLRGADLSGANFEAAILRDCELALANLYDARLVDADLTDSNWWRARGLSSDQLADLTLQFAPTADAPDSRQRDFERWLIGQIDSSAPPDTDHSSP